MRKIFILFISVCMLFTMSGCRFGKENVGADNSVKYELDNDAPQYYMETNSAASENGYYFIAHTAVTTDGAKRVLQFFDMSNMSTLVLCSKQDCRHDSTDCEAYLGENLGLWYYKERLYTIECGAEQDILVSYDKTGRDKKTVKVLSVEGNSVLKSDGRYCVTHGRLYYFTSAEKDLYLYSVSLDGSEEPVCLKEYSGEGYSVFHTMLYPVGDRVYLKNNYELIGNEGEGIYGLSYIDINVNEVHKLYDSTGDKAAYRGNADAKRESYLDENGNIYFETITDSEYIINKTDTATGVNTELFVLDLSADTGEKEAYTKLCGFDGTYLYINDAVDFSIKENRRDRDKKNSLQVIDTTGKVIDKLDISYNDEYTDNNGLDKETNSTFIKFIAGDSRYIVMGWQQYSVAGVELSEYNVSYYKDLSGQIKGQEKDIRVYAMGVLDKAKLGTGEISLINITP